MPEKKSGKKKQMYRRLPWEYCECGCHGFSVSLGSLRYWTDCEPDRKKDETFHLYRGHGWIPPAKELGRYDSLDAADLAVRKHTKPLIKDQLAQLKRAEMLLG